MESVRQMIEKRAYELFLQRGGQHGYQVADWIQAEKEVIGKLEKQQKAGGSKPSTKPAAAPAKAAAPAPAKKKVVKR